MWNGCAENYPEKTSPVAGSCCSQSQRCYNDGIGMADSGGNYVIENSNISFNAEDGLDLLHIKLNQPTAIIVRRTTAEGNAGNAIKTGATHVVIENNILISGCRYLEEAGFVAKGWGGGDNSCRAGGEPLALNIDRGSQHRIYNNTIIQTVEGKNSSIVDKDSNQECLGTENLDLKNNIWLGGNYLQYNDVQGCKGFTETDIRNDYSNVFAVRSGCPAGKNNICKDPLLEGFPTLTYSPRASAKLTASSPGLDRGISSLKFSDSPNDLSHSLRDAKPDIGAMEF
jgi:hypothetical protein